MVCRPFPFALPPFHPAFPHAVARSPPSVPVFDMYVLNSTTAASSLPATPPAAHAFAPVLPLLTEVADWRVWLGSVGPAQAAASGGQPGTPQGAPAAAGEEASHAPLGPPSRSSKRSAHSKCTCKTGRVVLQSEQILLESLTAIELQGV